MYHFHTQLCKCCIVLTVNNKRLIYGNSNKTKNMVVSFTDEDLDLLLCFFDDFFFGFDLISSVEINSLNIRTLSDSKPIELNIGSFDSLLRT